MIEDKKVQVATLVRALGVSVLDVYGVPELKRDFHSIIDLSDVPIFEDSLIRLVVDYLSTTGENNEVCMISGLSDGVQVGDKKFLEPGERVLRENGRIEILVGGE